MAIDLKEPQNLIAISVWLPHKNTSEWGWKFRANSPKYHKSHTCLLISELKFLDNAILP